MSYIFEQIANGMHDILTVCKLKLLLADILSTKLRHVEAISHMYECLDHIPAEEPTNGVPLAYIYYRLGDTLYDSGKACLAFQHYLTSLSFLSRITDSKELLITRGLLKNLALGLVLCKMAIVLPLADSKLELVLEEDKTFIVQIGRMALHLVDSLEEHGDIYQLLDVFIRLGEYDDARACALKQTQLLVKQPDSKLAAMHLHLAVARLCILHGNLLDGERELTAADDASCFVSNGQIFGRRMIKLQLALLYQRVGKLHEAKELISDVNRDSLATLGSDHPYTLYTLSQYRSILVDYQNKEIQRLQDNLLQQQLLHRQPQPQPQPAPKTRPSFAVSLPSSFSYFNSVTTTATNIGNPVVYHVNGNSDGINNHNSKI